MRTPARRTPFLLVSAIALSAALVLAPTAIGQDEGAILDPLPDPSPSNLALTLEPFAQLPPSQPTVPPTDARFQRVNRINHVGEVPDGSGRLYAPDLNGKMYLITDGEPVEYLDVGAQFDPYFWNHAGLGSGFGFVAFHPEFAENGKFYTVHTEGRQLDERPAPDLPHWPQISRHGGEANRCWDDVPRHCAVSTRPLGRWLSPRRCQRVQADSSEARCCSWGDDWAENHHDVEIVDGTGRVLARRRLPNGLDGITVLHALIGEHRPEGWADWEPGGWRAW